MLEWNIIFGIRLKKIWKKIKGDFKIKVYLSDGKFEICNSKTSENEVIFFYNYSAHYLLQTFSKRNIRLNSIILSEKID